MKIKTGDLVRLKKKYAVWARTLFPDKSGFSIDFKTNAEPLLTYLDNETWNEKDEPWVRLFHHSTGIICYAKQTQLCKA